MISSVINSHVWPKIDEQSDEEIVKGLTHWREVLNKLIETGNCSSLNQANAPCSLEEPEAESQLLEGIC